jgi:hypothetical protein
MAGGDAGGCERRSLHRRRESANARLALSPVNRLASNGLAGTPPWPLENLRLPEQHPFGVAGDHADAPKTIAVLSSTA